MVWFKVLDNILLSICFIAEFYALFLLHRWKASPRQKIQVYLIMSVYLTEITYVIFAIICVSTFVPKINVANKWGIILIEAWYIRVIDFTLRLLFYFFMTLVTLDRFLTFYLNVKYSSYCSTKRLLKLVLSTIAVLLTIVLSVTISIYFKQISFDYVSLLMPIMLIFLDTLYLLVASATLIYVIMVYTARVKLRKISSTGIEKHNQLKLFVPILLIVTFILFIVFPDILYMLMAHGLLEFHENIVLSLLIAYHFGWLVDPLIFIYCFHSNRKRRKSQLSETKHELNKMWSNFKIFEIAQNCLKSNKTTFRAHKLPKTIKKETKITKTIPRTWNTEVQYYVKIIFWFQLKGTVRGAFNYYVLAKWPKCWPPSPIVPTCSVLVTPSPSMNVQNFTLTSHHHEHPSLIKRINRVIL